MGAPATQSVALMASRCCAALSALVVMTRPPIQRRLRILPAPETIGVARLGAIRLRPSGRVEGSPARLAEPRPQHPTDEPGTLHPAELPRLAMSHRVEDLPTSGARYLSTLVLGRFQNNAVKVKVCERAIAMLRVATPSTRAWRSAPRTRRQGS